MPATVSALDLGTLSAAGVRSGAPVRGVTWARVAAALNYLNGTARCLIPCYAPSVELLVANGVQTFGVKVWPSYQATHRLWVVTLGPTAQDEAIGTELEFTDPSGGTATFVCTGSIGSSAPQTFEHVETVTSRTSAESTLSWTMESVTGSHVVTGVTCWELPRPDLAIDASDLGIELGSLDGNAPVYDGVTGYSLGALPEALAGALTRGRRHIFQWAVPATTSKAWATTSTSYVDVFDYYPEGLERLLYSGETTADVEVRIYAWVSGGTGDVQITMANGDSASVSISAASPTWSTISGLAIRCEDMSTATGRRTSADTIRVQARKNTSGTIYVAGVSIVGRGS